MKKMISLAALAVVIASPVFAQDSKPVSGATAPVAPVAGKVEAPKVDASKPAAAVTGTAAPAATAPAVKAVEAPKVDAGKPTTAPATTAVTPKIDDKKVEAPKADAKALEKKSEAPKVETKPAGLGGPKVEDKKVEAPKADAGKTVAPAVTTAAPAAPAAKAADVKPVDTKTDVKKQ